MGPETLTSDKTSANDAKALSGADQALLYANDLAQLYKRVREETARLARHETRLGELVRISLELVESASLEAAATRLATELAAFVGSPRTAVFLARAGRCRLQAQTGEPPLATAFALAPAQDLGHAPAFPEGEPWSALGYSGTPLVVPLRGHAGHALGFAAAQLTASFERRATELTLLARIAGAVIEVHAVDAARSERRSRSGAMAVPSGEEPALASLRGESRAMKAVRELILKVAATPAPVVITGETGTGKELVARAIHDASPRRKGPFIAVNCGALPDTLIESELFGHEAGAFTGAQKRHRGRIELADGGTLFLDELGEMPKAAQVKLLRFLQDSKFLPLGAEQERVANVRVLAATNKDLDTAVEKGEVRSDLVFRLNVFHVKLPPLREREGDAVVLARALGRETAERAGLPEPVFTPAAEAALAAYAWPGNVRELGNIVERAVLLSGGQPIGPEVVPGGSREPAAPRPAPTPVAVTALVEPTPPPPDGGREAPGADLAVAVAPGRTGDLVPYAEARAALLARFDIAYCEAALARAEGNVARAARLAHLDKKNLHRRIKTLKLDPRRWKP